MIIDRYLIQNREQLQLRNVMNPMLAPKSPKRMPIWGPHWAYMRFFFAITGIDAFNVNYFNGGMHLESEDVRQYLLLPASGHSAWPAVAGQSLEQPLWEQISDAMQ